MADDGHNAGIINFKSNPEMTGFSSTRHKFVSESRAQPNVARNTEEAIVLRSGASSQPRKGAHVMVRSFVDELTHALLEQATRRGLLRLVMTLPALAGLAALLMPDGEAGRRRKRRQARHRHDPGGRKGKRNKRCKKKAKFCQSRCGNVKKKGCKKPLNCGACRVFLTSTTQDGNLGGLTGADAICQNLAATVNLPGVYRAWLSDDAQSPATRFSQSSGPYELLNGATIANSWSDLTDGSLVVPITLAENGTTFDDPSLRAWTNTLANGTAGGVLNANCTGWTTGANGSDGDEGQVTATSENWTVFASGTCNNTFHLYCFQQSNGIA